MKFWQLVGTATREVVKTIALSEPSWSEFADWIAQFDALVRSQDRKKLDYLMPDELVTRALDQSGLVCFLSKNGWLRSWRMSPEDSELSATEAYRRYGGEVVERVFDNGVSAVSSAVSDTERLINEVRFRRLALLPPYCLDGDENEKTLADYANFYRQNVCDAISATASYIDALKAFAEEPDRKELFGELLDARRWFAKAFPFCDDELAGVVKSELPAYHDYLLKTYRQDVKNGFLQRNVATYLDTLKAIKAKQARG